MQTDNRPKKRTKEKIYLMSCYLQKLSPLLFAEKLMKTKTLSDYWQYIAWSIWGGIGFISVPSSCSILYLFPETVFNQNNVENRKGQQSCSGKICIQVKPILIGDQINSQAKVTKSPRSTNLTSQKGC